MSPNASTHATDCSPDLDNTFSPINGYYRRSNLRLRCLSIRGQLAPDYPRESKGISQQNLAAVCNFEKANLSRIEAGRTNPTVSTLYKISQALETTISELVDVEG